MSVEIFTEDKANLREKPNSHGALYPHFLVPRLSEEMLIVGDSVAKPSVDGVGL